MSHTYRTPFLYPSPPLCLSVNRSPPLIKGSTCKHLNLIPQCSIHFENLKSKLESGGKAGALQIERFKEGLTDKGNQISGSLKRWYEIVKSEKEEWGVGFQPIFRICETSEGMQVKVDENEVMRRWLKDPKLAKENLFKAKKIAADIENGVFQPPHESSVFQFVKQSTRTKNRNHSVTIGKPIEILHRARPFLVGTLVLLLIYSVVDYLVYAVFLKPSEAKEQRRDVVELRELRAQLDQPLVEKELQENLAIDDVKLRMKVRKIRQMAAEARIAEEHEEDSSATQDWPAQLRSLANKPASVKHSDVVYDRAKEAMRQKEANQEQDESISHLELDTQRLQTLSNQLNEVQVCGNTRAEDVRDEDTDKNVGSDAEPEQVNGQIKNGIPIGSLNSGTKPRIITSYDEAVTLLSSGRKRSTDVTPKPKEESRLTKNRNKDGSLKEKPPQEHGITNTVMANATQSKRSIDRNANNVGNGYSSVGLSEGNQGSTKVHPVEENPEQEEIDWMRDDVLREIVFKMKANEQAGRDPFHGLNQEEKLFFKGLERKYEREGETVKAWIDERVRRLDLGKGDNMFKSQATPLNVKPSLRSNAGKIPMQPQKQQTSTSNNNGDGNFSRTSGNPRRLTKKWTPELQKKYDMSDLETKSLMDRMGKDLRAWATDEQIKEAKALFSADISTEDRKELLRNFLKAMKPDLKEDGKSIRQEQLFDDQYQRSVERVSKMSRETLAKKYQQYKPPKDAKFWWFELQAVLCISFEIEDSEGRRQGIYTIDMAQNVEEKGSQRSKVHAIAFEDRADALHFADVLHIEHEKLPGIFNIAIVPCKPKTLYNEATAKGIEVMVLKKQQLRLYAGQPLEDVEEMILGIYRKSIIEQHSIDIGGVLDDIERDS